MGTYSVYSGLQHTLMSQTLALFALCINLLQVTPFPALILIPWLAGYSHSDLEMCVHVPF